VTIFDRMKELEKGRERGEKGRERGERVNRVRE
jgi:hypothetical protein